MAAHRFNAPLLQFGAKLFWRETVRSREFCVLNSKPFDLIQSSRHIFLKLLAQTVKLQADRTFEAFTRSHRCRKDTGNNSGRNGQAADSQNKGSQFHLYVLATEFETGNTLSRTTRDLVVKQLRSEFDQIIAPVQPRVAALALLIHHVKL